MSWLRYVIEYNGSAVFDLVGIVTVFIVDHRFFGLELIVVLLTFFFTMLVCQFVDLFVRIRQADFSNALALNIISLKIFSPIIANVGADPV